MVRRLALPILVLALAAPLFAEGPVLHEYVPDLAGEADSALVGAPGEPPSAFLYEGELVAAPLGGRLRPDEVRLSARSALFGAPAGAAGGPSYRPDRLTSLEGTLGYFSVFNPSITPFKRLVALDRVVESEDGTPEFELSDARGRAVPILGPEGGPEGGAGRDRFWGSVVVDFSEGARVPLPSVAPDARILTLRTEPETLVRIERDAADNFHVVSLEGARREVRLTFLTDAPQSYFNTRIPEVASDVLASEATPLPASIQARAESFAAELGLRRGDDLPRVLEVLTAHFRSFEEGDQPPDDTGDTYLDLARGMRGVCRHRAYAYVITLLGLGVPARFVRNEAHAWAEVRLPGVGFMRVDLGGAAVALRAHGDEGRTLYRPREPDPLPQPPGYRDNYTQRVGTAPASAQGDAVPDVAPAGARSDGPDGSGAASGRGSLHIALDQRHFDVFRGRALDVGGKVADASGAGTAGIRVEILLAGDRELLLGVTVSAAGGRFDASVGVPPDVPVGDYHLVVRTPGDELHAPATAP